MSEFTSLDPEGFSSEAKQEIIEQSGLSGDWHDFYFERVQFEAGNPDSAKIFAIPKQITHFESAGSQPPYTGIAHNYTLTPEGALIFASAHAYKEHEQDGVTHRELSDHSLELPPAEVHDSTLGPRVIIKAGTKVINATLRHVEVGAMTVIKQSEVIARQHAAQKTGPTVIGAGARIESSNLYNVAAVGNTTTITHGSVLTDGANIGWEADLRGVNLAPFTRVGNSTQLQAVTTGSDVAIGSMVNAKHAAIASNTTIGDKSQIENADIGKEGTLAHGVKIIGAGPQQPVRIYDAVSIEQYAELAGSQTVVFSHTTIGESTKLQDTTVHRKAVIGPYNHFSNSRFGEEVRVGAGNSNKEASVDISERTVVGALVIWQELGRVSVGPDCYIGNKAQILTPQVPSYTTVVANAIMDGTGYNEGAVIVPKTNRVGFGGRHTHLPAR